MTGAGKAPTKYPEQISKAVSWHPKSEPWVKLGA